MTDIRPSNESKRLNIVHVLTRFERAGTEENTAITCNGQVQAGHKVTLIYGRDFSLEALTLLDPAVTRLMAPSMVREIRPIEDVRAVVELMHHFRVLKADVVHTHQSKAGLTGRLAAALSGVRRIVHGVHILPFVNVSRLERAVYIALEKLVAPFTHAFIHVTPALREESLAVGLGSADQHFVVPSGMDLRAFRTATPPDDAVHLTRPVRPEGPPARLILVVSSLEPRKRQREFLQVLRGVVDSHRDVRVIFAGQGPDREAILAEAERLGLADNIELLGSRTDVPSLIALADICVLASEREGLPRAVIQYAVGGRPIVAAALPDIGRVVQEGVNGFLSPTDDLSPMTGRLTRLLEDDDLRRRMGEASANMDFSDWEGALMCDRISEVYDWVANARVRGPAASSGADRPVQEPKNRET